MTLGNGPGGVEKSEKGPCWKVFTTISTGLNPEKILKDFFGLGPIEMWKTRARFLPLANHFQIEWKIIDTVY